MRVHFVANMHRADACRAARDAADWAITEGHEVGFEAETAAALSEEALSESRFALADLVVAFGGDGTLIRAAHLCAPSGAPILGVYFGRFGFVTQCDAAHAIPEMKRFLDGQSELEPRMMLQAVLHRGSQAVTSLHSLNEIVIQRAATARMMTIRILIDGHRITSYPADGIIVSTPTGSTAYNLSAGGPILSPNIKAMTIAAIAPHTLSSRPFVIRPESEVRLRILSDGDSVLSADGQTRLHILKNDEISITRSPLVTNLVTVRNDDFLRKLGDRLFWSKGLVGEHE
jgi:NAD+ kinase